MNRLRHLLLIVFFIFVAESFGQIKIKTYTTATDTNYWKRYEHVLKPAKANLKRYTARNGSSALEAFLANPPEEFRNLVNDTLTKETDPSLKKHLYPVDLNNDQRPDIIFNGSGRDATEMVRIYLNQQDGFELVFEDYRYVSALQEDKTGFSRLIIGDAGDKEDYLYFERDYTLQSENGTLIFVRGLQQVTYKYTQRPRKMFARAIPFRSANDTTLVRASAATLDEPYNPGLKTFGNIICGYTAFINGNILASEREADGHLWYFVEIYPGERPHKSLFYGIERTPTKIIGWIDSEDILGDFIPEKQRPGIPK